MPRLKRISLLFCAASLLVSSAGLTMAQQQEAASGAVRWIVDWQDNSCRLMRGGPGQPLVMELRTITPQGGAGLTIGNHGWAKDRPELDAVDLVLIPSLDRFRVPAQTAPAVSGGMLMVGELPDDFLTRISASEGLRVEASGQTIAEFRYASAASAIRQLAVCNEELLKSWGVDPTSFARLNEKAVPLFPPWRAFFPSDYPPAALDRRHQGTVIARYTVGTDGKVSHCEIARSSGHGVLDRKACVLLTKRLRYKPAVGKDGEPAPMVTAIPVRWIIPR